MDADQERNVRIYIARGKELGADQLALLAALCAGSGENNWHTDGCNSGGYCGTWQIGRSWQLRRGYRDVAYWTDYAYLHGFYGGFGGIIHISRVHPDYSPGRIANMCQGAFSNLDQGANYYDQYLGEARHLLATHGHVVVGDLGGGGGGPPATHPHSPPPVKEYDWSPVLRNASYWLGVHGARAKLNAGIFRDYVHRTTHCDLDGPRQG